MNVRKCFRTKLKILDSQLQRVVVTFFLLSTDRVLPDFRFSGGFMTSDLDRLTRSDLRLTSRMKAEALSGSLIIGLCLVGVTQYSCVVVNILVVFNMLAVFLFLSD